MRVPCACVYLHAFERSCTRWIKLLPERLTIHCTRCLWTWRSAARSMLSLPQYYCVLVWGRWLKFAAFVLVQKQCAIRSSCRNGRWSCLCAICIALCISAYASAKEEKTASSIVQFECVSLLVRLTCHRSYPTSHSFTLKNSSDPGMTFRSLTVVRNISFFLCEAWTTCSVLYSSAESVILLCAACNDVSEHAYMSRVMRKGTLMTSASYCGAASQSDASQYAMYD